MTVKTLLKTYMSFSCLHYKREDPSKMQFEPPPRPQDLGIILGTFQKLHKNCDFSMEIAFFVEFFDTILNDYFIIILYILYSYTAMQISTI